MAAVRRDVATLGEVLRGEWTDLQKWAATLDADQWAQPSVIDGWTVRELVTHLAVGMGALINAEAPKATAEALTPNEWFGYASRFADGIAEGARQKSQDAGDDTIGLLRSTWDDAEAALARWGNIDQVVAIRMLGTRWSDLIATRILEIVVHTDDLNRSLPDHPHASAPDAQRIAVRTLLDMLAERAPGKAVEVRIPPFAAVQTIEGVSHTRGTPPNVVEMAPKTWLRLATGRFTWDEAVSVHDVTLSGSKAAEVSKHLPLL